MYFPKWQITLFHSLINSLNCLNVSWLVLKNCQILFLVVWICARISTLCTNQELTVLFWNNFTSCVYIFNDLFYISLWTALLDFSSTLLLFWLVTITGFTHHFFTLLFLFFLLVSPHFSVHCLQPQCEGRLEAEVDAASVFTLAVVVSTVLLEPLWNPSLVLPFLYLVYL